MFLGLLGDPACHQLGLAFLVVAVAVPLSASAALGLWQAGRFWRWLALAAAVLVAFLPPTWLAAGCRPFFHSYVTPNWSDLVAEGAGQVARLSALLLLLLTGRLNRLDPAGLRAAAASGAGPWRALRLTALPALRLPVVAGLVLFFRLVQNWVAFI